MVYIVNDSSNLLGGGLDVDVNAKNAKVIVNIDEIHSKFKRIQTKYTASDIKKDKVRKVLKGELNTLYPEVFPDMGSFAEPIVANMVDVAARDMAESLHDLPTYSCFSTSMSSEKDRGRATKKNKIIGCYINNSRLEEEMRDGSIRLVSFGTLIGRVAPDFDDKVPYIRLLDSIGTYPEYDHRRRLVGYFEKRVFSKDDLILQYPLFADEIKGKKNDTSKSIEVIFYHNKDVDVVYFARDKAVELQSIKNPIGRCMAAIVERSHDGDVPRGQFDDVLPVQLAKARMALLALRTSEDVVNAQLILPTDVNDVPVGPNAIIRTNNPEGIRYVPRQVAPDAWREQQQLDRELNLGARFPESRTGTPAGSGTVTGAGQDALLGAYDSQIDGYRIGLARFHQELINICFEVDEKVFGDVEKTLIGFNAGSSYQLTYSASKVIAGDYSVSTRYGLMAGLNPNQMLVFGLQALQSDMFSKGFLRRELPISFDVEEEEREIDVQKLNDAGMQALMAYGASIPQLAAQGMDVTHPLKVLSDVMKARRDGINLITAITDAFSKATEEQQQAVQDPSNPTQQVPGSPGLTQQQPQDPNAQGAGGQAGGQAGGGSAGLGSLLASLHPNGQAGVSGSLKQNF